MSSILTSINRHVDFYSRSPRCSLRSAQYKCPMTSTLLRFCIRPYLIYLLRSIASWNFPTKARASPTYRFETTFVTKGILFRLSTMSYADSNYPTPNSPFSTHLIFLVKTLCQDGQNLLSVSAAGNIPPLTPKLQYLALGTSM